MKVNLIIPGSTISKKNSKQLVSVKRRNGKTGMRPISSDNYLAWAEGAKWYLKQYSDLAPKWKYPVKVFFSFYRPDNRRFDFNNMSQGPLDVMVSMNIIRDDDIRSVLPYPANPAVEVDKENPRVEIYITDEE